jgi:hypothetical protein
MSIEPTATAAQERPEAIRRGIDSIAAALEEVPQLIIGARKAEFARLDEIDKIIGR